MATVRAGLVWFVALVVGCAGDPAASSLVRFADEPAGANCAAGGLRIDAGVDDDGNGVLDDDEVTETSYVCDGSDGDDAADTLIETTVIAPGGACGDAAGLSVATGVDDDGDGVLDDDEIDATETLCDGADGSDGSDGSSTLIETTPIDPSPACPLGGVLIETGVDDDGDGVLDDLEIDASSEVCSTGDGAGLGPVYTGDYMINDATDVLFLDSVRVIDGDLRIQPSAYLAVDLPELETVTGTIYVVQGTLTSAALTSAGAIEIIDGGLHAATLDTVGYLYIGRYDGNNLTLPALRVASEILFSPATASANPLNLPALESLGRLSIQSSPLTAAPLLGSVTSVERLEILMCLSLADLTGLAGITAVTDRLTLTLLPAVTSLAPLGGLVAAGEVTVDVLPQITNLAAFDGLTTVRELHLLNLPALTSITGLASLTTVASNLELSNLGALTSLAGLEALTAAPTVRLDRLPQVVSLTPLAGLTAVTDITVRELGAITSLAPLAAATATRWSLVDLPGITSLAVLAGRTTLAHVELGALPQVTSVAAFAGVAITESVVIDTVPITSLASLDGLATTARLQVNAGASLTSLDGLDYITRLRGLNVIGSFTDVDGLAGLTQVDEAMSWDLTGTALILPSLTSVGVVALIFTTGTRIELPALTTAGAVGIYASSLAYLDLGALTELTGNLLVNAGAAFPRCHADDVAAALDAGGWTGVYTLSGGTPCEDIDFCRLQAPTSTTVTASSAVAFYGRLFIDGLTTLSIGVDVSPVLRAAAGVGADATDPATHASWTWTAAAATPGWDGSAWSEPNNDEYTATVTAPAVAAAYDTAFRFSGDGGRTWTFCDRNAGGGADGSQNGYQIANAGALTVSL